MEVSFLKGAEVTTFLSKPGNVIATAKNWKGNFLAKPLKNMEPAKGFEPSTN